VLLSAVTAAGDAHAGKTVWQNDDNADNKLTLFGDLRFRYETDRHSREGKPDRSRIRQRIRIRFGAKYTTGPNVEAGFRLATGSTSIQSPHQTLGMDDAEDNAKFGVDRGYVKYSAGGFWLWGGKNATPVFQQSYQWIDVDLSPEGIALGYKAGPLDLSLAQFVLHGGEWDNNYESGAGEEDEGMLLVGAHGELKPGGMILDLAAYNLSTSGTADAVPLRGGNTDYTMLAARLAKGGMKCGVEYFTSGVDLDKHVGAGNKGGDKNGLVVYVKGKINKTFGAGIYYHDIGYASMPEFGKYSQDDFPYSANFTGTRLQLDIDPGNGMKIDIRYYSQEVKNDAIAVWNSDVVQSGRGNKRTRIQANFNVGF